MSTTAKRKMMSTSVFFLSFCITIPTQAGPAQDGIGLGFVMIYGGLGFVLADWDKSEKARIGDVFKSSLDFGLSSGTTGMSLGLFLSENTLISVKYLVGTSTILPKLAGDAEEIGGDFYFWKILFVGGGLYTSQYRIRGLPIGYVNDTLGKTYTSPLIYSAGGMGKIGIGLDFGAIAYDFHVSEYLPVYSKELKGGSYKALSIDEINELNRQSKNFFSNHLEFYLSLGLSI